MAIGWLECTQYVGGGGQKKETDLVIHLNTSYKRILDSGLNCGVVSSTMPKLMFPFLFDWRE